jgi:hypothetical protein
MLFRMVVLGGAAISAKRGLLQCAGAAGLAVLASAACVQPPRLSTGC